MIAVMVFDVFRRLWQDDRGAIISVEFLFLVTILGIGLITGWVTLRNSINAEFEELAAAIGILSQGYSFGGQLISLALEGAQTDGSAAVDTPNPSAVIVNVSATTGVGGSNNTGTLIGDPLY